MNRILIHTSDKTRWQCLILSLLLFSSARQVQAQQTTPSPVPDNGVPSGVTIITAPPGQLDLTPPPPQPNDITGTVNGCASALASHDLNHDGTITRGEYLGFVNEVANLLCIPPRPVLDLELQTVFLSIACLCEDREGSGSECCFGPQAGIVVQGAKANTTDRLPEQDTYLRAACLLTQAVLGPEQCIREPVTLSPGAVGNIQVVTPAPLVPADDNKNLLWLLLLLLVLLLCCCIACCCKKRGKQIEEEYETTIKEEVTTMGPTQLKSNEEPPVAPGPHMLRSRPVQREAPADEEEDEGAGRRYGEAPDADGDDEYGRKFRGEGVLPPSPEFVGLKLRHIEKEPPLEQDYRYPERNLEEFQYKPEDSAQELDHYVPDGGVYDPQRAKKGPVQFTPSKYERAPKPEPVYVDPRKHRKQMRLGDGEVWEALKNYDDDTQNTSLGSEVETMDWVINSALTVFGNAEETGDLMNEEDSEEEYDDGEDEERELKDQELRTDG